MDSPLILTLKMLLTVSFFLVQIFALNTETNSPYIACETVIIYKKVVQHTQISEVKINHNTFEIKPIPGCFPRFLPVTIPGNAMNIHC